MSKLISLNLPAPETRNVNLENPNVSLSAALLGMGMGAYTDSNERVTEQTSLEVPTVLACVRILSESIGSLPFRVYEELPRGRRVAKDHPLYYLLTQEANPETTAVTFLTTMAVHATLWQNAYAEIERDPMGRVTGLWPRLPWRTKAKRANGRLVYETTDTPQGLPRVIHPDDMLHVVGFSLDGLTGTQIITAARQSIGLAMVAARFGARFYANGARPGFFLQPENPLSPEDMKLLREDVEIMSSGGNAHRVAAVPNGIKITPVPIDPSQAEYIATRKLERSEIAAIFRVPRYMVGDDGEKMGTKSTVEQQNSDFLNSTLRPWLDRFSQEFERKLLPVIGRNAGKFSLHFYTDALLSIDRATRYATYTQGRNGGWLSINDIREMEGLPPVPSALADDYLQPLNMESVINASADIEVADEEADSGEVTSDESLGAEDIPNASRARALYLPLYRDAINRLQHRGKPDFESMKVALTPLCSSLGTYFRTSETAGNSEQGALDKYLRGLSTRVSNVNPDEDFEKLLKAIVFATQQDEAEAKAKEILSHE